MPIGSWKKFFLRKKENSKGIPQGLLQLLPFAPKSPHFYLEAFTHRSSQIRDDFGNEINYERLEFLGDAMLGAVIAEYLFQNLPSKPEGYLTQMRSKIVSRKHLNQIGEDLDLASYLSIQNTEGVTLSKNIHGDLFEALVGAIYMDQGFGKCAEFIYKIVIDSYVKLEELENRITSHKSLILEWSQKEKRKLRFTTFEEKNADDLTIFVSIVRIDDKIIAKGRGTSKKKAEENAAKRTYYSMQAHIKSTA